LLGKLQAASIDAFGQASQYLKDLPNSLEYTHASKGYLHVMPDTADIKNLKAFAIATKESLGKFGAYVLATDDKIEEYAKNYKSIMADLETAIAYWEATYKTLKAKYDAQQKAFEDSKAAFELYYAENIETLEGKVGVANGKASRIAELQKALLEAIMLYLPDEFTELTKVGGKYATKYTGLSKDITLSQLTTNFGLFIEFLEDEVEDAKKEVVEAEDDLANAKMWETLIENGKSGVELAKENLDAKIAKLEEAQAKLEEALANVAKGLEIIAAVNGTEDAE